MTYYIRQFKTKEEAECRKASLEVALRDEKVGGVYYVTLVPYRASLPCIMLAETTFARATQLGKAEREKYGHYLDFVKREEAESDLAYIKEVLEKIETRTTILVSNLKA